MKMKSQLSAFLTALFCSASFAGDPVTINVTGNVIASPCTFDTSASNLNINLGEKGASELAVAGSSMPEKTFDLAFKDCPASTTKVTATFTGTNDDTSTIGTAFKNTGTATNMVVQIKPVSGSWAADSFQSGSTMTVNVNAAAKTAKFALAARAYTPTGSVNPGTINSSIVADFTYQ